VDVESCEGKKEELARNQKEKTRKKERRGLICFVHSI
jgi:hypothetical protein